MYTVLTEGCGCGGGSVWPLSSKEKRIGKLLELVAEEV
jgi:hypothetical protein